MKEIGSRLSFHDKCRHRISDSRSPREHAFRRRSSAHSPGFTARFWSRGRFVCSRRADNRPPSARQRQTHRTLSNLRNLGNTIIVVEHDEDTMFASDYIVDIGPGAGIHGGKVVVSGWLEDLLTKKTLAKEEEKNRSRLAYLRGEKKHRHAQKSAVNQRARS